MTAKMKLFVVETMGSGGMIHYAYQLCAALAKQNIDLTLITTTDYELDQLPHNFKAVKLLNLWQMFDPNAGKGGRDSTLGKAKWEARRLWRGAKLICEWVKLTRYLRREKPDVVQFGKINFPFEALFLRYLRRRGIMLTQICHEFEARESGRLGAALSDGLGGGIFSNFSALFFMGDTLRARFLKLYENVPASAAHIIEHGNQDIFRQLAQPGLNLRERYGLKPHQPVALFFGNLTPSKGLPDLIDAFALAITQSPEARLLVAGYPSKHLGLPALRGQIDALQLTDSVILDARYLPFAEVAALMELATCVIYPYRSSAQSGSLQVAYSFGRPVVVTNVGGLPEVVEDGRSGFVVPAQSPQKLALAMGKLLADPQLAAKMGACARSLSQTRFSWDKIAAQISLVYAELTKAPPTI